jgi:Flp pilus assembly protein TadG
MRLARARQPGRQGGGRAGSAAVEAAFALPVVLFMLLGLWEMARVAEMNQVLNNAAREAGRQASTGLLTYDQINTVVQNYLTSAGLTNQSGLRVDIVNLTSGSVGPQTHGPATGTKINDYDPTGATELDQIQVTVTLPFANANWTSPRLMTNASTQCTGSAVWASAKDQVYPSTVTPPAGS